MNLRKPHSADRRTANVFRVRVDKLDFHPRLALVPLLEEIATQVDHHGDPKRKERLERLNGDWTAFVEDIKTNGVIEPVKVVRGARGRYLVCDGRNRTTGARAAEVGTVPAILVKPEDVDTIVTSTVIGRRHWTKSMKAWLAVLMNPSVIHNTPGGDVKADHSNKIGMKSRGALARQFGVSDELINQACDIHRGCYDAKGLQTKLGKVIEPSIWLGASLGGIKSGMAAEAEADGQKGKAKPDSSSKGYLRKLTPFITNLVAIDKWDPALRAISEEATAREFARLPEAARAFISDALVAADTISRNAAEPPLQDCAACGRKNFTPKGFKSHKCKPAPAAAAVKPEARLHQTFAEQLVVGDHVRVGTSQHSWKVTVIKPTGHVILQREHFMKSIDPNTAVRKEESLQP